MPPNNSIVALMNPTDEGVLMIFENKDVFKVELVPHDVILFDYFKSLALKFE